MSETLKQFEKRCAQLLIDGTEGSDVVKLLQTRFRTLSSIDSAFSHVRKLVMESGARASGYDDSALRALLPSSANGQEITSFVDAPLKDQVRIKRAHGSNPTWSAEEEAALSEVKLLPPNMEAFGFTKAQSFALKRQKEENLVKKNETMIVVDPGRIIEACTAALKAADVATSFPALAIPLLVLSGRRQTEMMGNGSFAPGPVLMSATFTGQLKRKSQEAGAYVIPLLCPYDVFAKGIAVLRAKQATLRPHDQTDTRDVESRYSPDIARALKNSMLLSLPDGIKCHDLRTIYFNTVYWCYTSPYSFDRTAMCVLGHDDLHSAKAYGNVRIENAAALYGAFGPLPM
jgi:hypothetical protein